MDPRTDATNRWCQTLGIERPQLEAVALHPEANAYSMLIVALLERGEAMTLEQVAHRFARAGIARASDALASLSRCRPARPPVYRDGDGYYLDPHDDELDLWVFRLGLRPPRLTPSPQAAKPPPPPPPSPPSVAVTRDELLEAWKDASLYTWSAQRIVLAVLDATGGPAEPAEVVAFVRGCTQYELSSRATAQFGRPGCPVVVLRDGRWAIAADAEDALVAMRKVVRARLETVRRWASARPDPSLVRQNIEALRLRRVEHGAALAKLKETLIIAHPAKAPRAVALLDVAGHTIETFVDEELARVPERLSAFDLIGAIDVRPLLRMLRFEPGDRRLAELGPPQKTKKLNRRGRTLKITTEMLVSGSCGISRPLGDPAKLDGYLAAGAISKLRARLEANVKSLHALFEYGRLHAAVRLRWGFLDEFLPAPWVCRDEPTLHDLKEAALRANAPLDVVVGTAPGWSDPWSRAQRAWVAKPPTDWRSVLVDAGGFQIVEEEIQRARLAGAALPPHEPTRER
ncbi:MAG: hypothetical protein JW940_20205 [Polyangiaceae bacterium]|nr:hypothetical protein [Polyangiaceae bacterium]